MRDFDSNRIYEILGEEFKNIYIVDCKTQQIHAFKETDVLPNVIKLRNGIFEGNTKNVLLFFCRKFEFFC